MLGGGVWRMESIRSLQPVSSPLSLPRRNALSKMEEVSGVVSSFNLLQAWQVGTVIGVLPVGQVGVDVVDVGATVGVGAHRLPCARQPGMVRGDDGGGVVGTPARVVLDGEECVAMHEGRRIRSYVVDCAAKGIDADPALAEDGGSLAAGNGLHEGVDTRARQGSGEVVGFGPKGVSRQLALRVLTGQVTFVHGLAVATRFVEHGVEHAGTCHVVTCGCNTDAAGQLLQ